MKLLKALALTAAVFLTGAAAHGANGMIQIKGSDTMVNLGQAWAEGYMRKNPAANIAVTGGGSGTGIAALINGTTDIAEASRAIKPAEADLIREKGGTPVEIRVAVDGIMVVLNKKNPIKKLTVEQLAGIFSGRITNWKQVGGRDAKIILLSREVNSGTHVYFKEHVLNGGDSKGKVEFAKTALLLPSSQDIVNRAGQDINSIGYVGMGYATNKIKEIPIAQDASSPYVMPTETTVLDNTYPISRPLFFYTNGKQSAEVDAFIKFVLSKEGQSIVADQGFVPLSSKDLSKSKQKSSGKKAKKK